MRLSKLNIYEINTIAWLDKLSRSLGTKVDLARVPEEYWDKLAASGFNAVWLMGVWQRSPAARAINLKDPAFVPDMKRVLPNFAADRDLAGSAYSIKNYALSERIGGDEGLRAARRRLNERGMKLIIDYVPNHTAPDHPWTALYPEYYIQGSEDELAADPSAYIRIGGNILARGRDPLLDPWSDVVQLNVFEPRQRAADIQLLKACAQLADGVRCDMAMLLLSRIFSQTWGDRAGKIPAVEFWAEIIAAVKQAHPDMIFMAESYWGTQDELLSLGFDYCYDKDFLDLLLAKDVRGLSSNLIQAESKQQRLIRFLENHDESRAAAAFSIRLHRLAALLLLTVPGQKLFYDGQLSGFKIRTPVQLNRDPVQRPDPDITRFYKLLLEAAKSFAAGVENFSLVPSGVSQVLGKGHSLCWSWDSRGKSYLAAANFSNRRLLLYPRTEKLLSSGRVKFQTSGRHAEVWLKNGRLILSLGSLEGIVIELS